MSEFSLIKIPILGADLNGESCLPPLAEMAATPKPLDSALDEDDEVYLGYGFLTGSFPYRHQDLYSRELKKQVFDGIVLENRCLRATFLPTLGGRLWSLFDKVAERELTFSNPVFRPGNLAVRNAWFSGGVEWNFGMVGHHPFTCSPVFAARLTSDDGTPVLRIYEFERIRCCTYQIDFFLPDESTALLCRTRIVNPTMKTVPVYWWSNIAVPENRGSRVIVPANEAYINRDFRISKTPVPRNTTGTDITYPVNSPCAMDYFWKVADTERRYICHLDENGYGLIQTSTDRLRGRKLFVWGQGPGGDNWQEYLSGAGHRGRYVEIQAGLAQTQYECLPMPPKSAWEWLEAYGAMNADRQKVHGDWAAARKQVEQSLETMVPRRMLEEILVQSKTRIALKPAEEILCFGSGWGALENRRRDRMNECRLSEHLDFGQTTDEQAPWIALLETGSLSPVEGDRFPSNHMIQDEWTTLLQNSVGHLGQSDWHTWYQLALVRMAEGKHDDARMAFAESLRIEKTSWAFHGLACLESLLGRHESAAALAQAAFDRDSESIPLIKEVLRLLLKAGRNTAIIALVEGLPPAGRTVGRIGLAYALASIRLGNVGRAEEILKRNDGLIVPDIREGENSVTDLWFEIERAKAELRGEVFDAGQARPPKKFDFRMMVERISDAGKGRAYV